MLGLGLFSFLIVGVIAGYVATNLTGRNHTLVQNLLTGIVGAYLGGALFWVIGLRATGFIGAIVVATIGSIVLLYLLDRFHKNRG